MSAVKVQVTMVVENLNHQWLSVAVPPPHMSCTPMAAHENVQRGSHVAGRATARRAKGALRSEEGRGARGSRRRWCCRRRAS